MRYRGKDAADSFVSTRHVLTDMARMQEIGIGTYMAELAERERVVHALLAGYNDGRRKTLFCICLLYTSRCV